MAYIINAKTKEVIEVETVVEPLTAEEARSTRNKLLVMSDWTQVADAPVDQAAWAEYRQNLRDIPKQEGFPESIVWPLSPDAVVTTSESP